jgi:hypothetical protein
LDEFFTDAVNVREEPAFMGDDGPATLTVT